jgi:hypothetical protein
MDKQQVAWVILHCVINPLGQRRWAMLEPGRVVPFDLLRWVRAIRLEEPIQDGNESAV